MHPSHLLLAVCLLLPPATLTSCDPQDPADENKQSTSTTSRRDARAKLQAQGIEPAQYNRELLKAVAEGKPGRLKLLLAAGADPNTRQNQDSALFIAAYEGHTDCLNALLEAGADVNARNFDTQTALFKAAQKGHPSCVKALLAAGADVNAKDPDGWQALHVAKSPAIIKALLSHGADINAQTDDSIGTPLHFAVRHGRVECARTLIEAGADVNTGNTFGETPLHVAVSKNRIDCARILIEAGADVDACDTTEGLSPLRMAEQNSNTAMIRLLQAGSKSPFPGHPSPKQRAADKPRRSR
ncbi:MAG TPA: ankyrin repeat domain-containing protein [Candidatus Akkermansia intestinigallinarum]|uniref:Ankyrin repeat domain-containing protein n=1 Tax=Candidatus Akkermansia intestinigallinarum TaxID=2838431 RepID=A0A9D1VB33_9BACT|nr:ankyrin repeat domain-containing protein [Candidatus Akkermansia intestinigallinarum]